MSRTVETLVSAARQEAGLTRTTSDVREAVVEGIALVQEDADANGIQIRLSLSDTLSPSQSRPS